VRGACPDIVHAVSQKEISREGGAFTLFRPRWPRTPSKAHCAPTRRAHFAFG
jgi:hypothetical protein